MRRQLPLKTTLIAVFITAVFFFGFPHSSFAVSPFVSQLQGLLSSLLGQRSTPPASSSSVPSGTGAGAPTIGLPFGGPIIFGPIKCDIPKGATYVIVGPPVSKPLLCQKGICKTYDAQPPYKLGQYLLGVALPAPPIPCIVGLSPVGAGFPIGMTPGVGASGGVSGGESVLSAPQSSCAQRSYTSNNTFTKGVAENAVREQLRAAGIGVNNDACDFGQDFQTHRRIFRGKGCTDLSGLQCESTDYLQDLQQTCGAGSLVVTGGSELGHITHDTGNAVDLSVKGTSLQSCLDTKTDRFTNLGGGKYKDKKTGSIFTFETGEAHYHVCIPGFGC